MAHHYEYSGNGPAYETVEASTLPQPARQTSQRPLTFQENPLYDSGEAGQTTDSLVDDGFGFDSSGNPPTQPPRPGTLTQRPTWVQENPLYAGNAGDDSALQISTTAFASYDSPLALRAAEQKATNIKVARSRRVAVVACVVVCVTLAVLLAALGGAGVFAPSSSASAATLYTGSVVLAGANASAAAQDQQFSTIDGDVEIVDTALTDAQVAAVLGRVRVITGYLVIANNSQLVDLSGLGNLTTVGGYVSIVNNTKLVALAGLQGLAELHGRQMLSSGDGSSWLVIKDNKALLAGNLFLNLSCKGELDGAGFAGYSECIACSSTVLDALNAGAGFVGAGKNIKPISPCVDLNECTAGVHDCSVEYAQCTNVAGSFTCRCNVGYSGDGVTCGDQNECTLAVHNCAGLNSAACTNTVGSFMCMCNVGFSGNGVLCGDFDECGLSLHNCAAGTSTCANTVGSFTCRCNLGYTGDGVACFDQNECASALHNCAVNAATCTNTVGSFSCACNAGFVGDGLACTDINECLPTNPCKNNASCTNTPGSFTCTCPPGWFGLLCDSNVNECASQPCLHGGQCVDRFNNFSCSCGAGWSGVTCGQNVNECTAISHNCAATASCTDTAGSFTCGCNAGYTGSGLTCSEVNECASNPCFNGGLCVDSVNKFTCQCASGWAGSICSQNINECASNPCLNGGVCTDRVNGFLCSCSALYSGSTCGTRLYPGATLQLTGCGVSSVNGYYKVTGISFNGLPQYRKITSSGGWAYSSASDYNIQYYHASDGNGWGYNFGASNGFYEYFYYTSARTPPRTGWTTNKNSNVADPPAPTFTFL